jgi:hypothetical protein
VKRKKITLKCSETKFWSQIYIKNEWGDAGSEIHPYDEDCNYQEQINTEEDGRILA